MIMLVQGKDKSMQGKQNGEQMRTREWRRPSQGESLSPIWIRTVADAASNEREKNVHQMDSRPCSNSRGTDMM